MPFYDSPSFGDPSKNGATRQPCIVCGHPTGDCSDEKSLPPETIWGYNTNSSLDNNQTYIMEEDYFDEREIGPDIFIKVLIFPKGKHIPLVKAKELGFII